MSESKVYVIKHGVKWVLNGRKPICPDCGFGKDNNKFIQTFELEDIELKNIEKVIGRRAIWKCPGCYCIFEHRREFDNED